MPSPHSHWLSYLLRQILTALMAKPFQPEVRIFTDDGKIRINPLSRSMTNSVNDILEQLQGPTRPRFHALEGGDSPVEGANAFYAVNGIRRKRKCDTPCVADSIEYRGIR